MRLVRLKETVPHKGVIRLHHLTDLHAGAPDFAEDEFLERRALIEQDEYARWTMGGDSGELIRHNDPRYEPSSVALRYRQATDIRSATREHLAELFDPIKTKCWGWADGNHEHIVDKHYGGHFGVEVCCDLGIEDRYIGERGLIQIRFTVGKRKASLGQLVDVQHGWQIGRLKGAFLVQAERELGMTDAAIVLRGHNHQPAAHTFRTLGVSHGGGQDGGAPSIVTRPRTVINGGSWRQGWRDLPPVDRNEISKTEKDLWGEAKGFRPEAIGGPIVVLSFDMGHGRGHGVGNYRPATIEHTTIEGHIDAARLGLAEPVAA